MERAANKAKTIAYATANHARNNATETRFHVYTVNDVFFTKETV